MKNTKKILAGLLALAMTSAFAACSNDDAGTTNDGEQGAEATAATTTAETTAALTTAIKEAELSEEQADSLSNALSQLQDVELANKEI